MLENYNIELNEEQAANRISNHLKKYSHEIIKFLGKNDEMYYSVNEEEDKNELFAFLEYLKQNYQNDDEISTLLSNILNGMVMLSLIVNKPDNSTSSSDFENKSILIDDTLLFGYFELQSEHININTKQFFQICKSNNISICLCEESIEAFYRYLTGVSTRFGQYNSDPTNSPRPESADFVLMKKYNHSIAKIGVGISRIRNEIEQKINTQEWWVIKSKEKTINYKEEDRIIFDNIKMLKNTKNTKEHNEYSYYQYSQNLFNTDERVLHYKTFFLSQVREIFKNDENFLFAISRDKTICLTAQNFLSTSHIGTYLIIPLELCITILWFYGKMEDQNNIKIPMLELIDYYNKVLTLDPVIWAEFVKTVTNMYEKDMINLDQLALILQNDYFYHMLPLVDNIDEVAKNEKWIANKVNEIYQKNKDYDKVIKDNDELKKQFDQELKKTSLHDKSNPPPLKLLTQCTQQPHELLPFLGNIQVADEILQPLQSVEKQTLSGCTVFFLR